MISFEIIRGFAVQCADDGHRRSRELGHEMCVDGQQVRLYLPVGLSVTEAHMRDVCDAAVPDHRDCVPVNVAADGTAIWQDRAVPVHGEAAGHGGGTVTVCAGANGDEAVTTARGRRDMWR